MEEQVLECVLPYINNNDDLNSVSLVSRKFYEIDSLTRKHVTVHVRYAPTPSRLSTRFPNIESLTLKGIPYELEYLSLKVTKLFDQLMLTPWVQELTVSDSFKSLKELCIRNMVVQDSDIEILARKLGKDLRVLKISKCYGFCEDGLMYVSKYCNHLKTFCLDNNFEDPKDSEDSEDEGNIEKDGKWLHELALNSKVIESFHLANNPFAFNVEDVTLLAKNCSKSLVSLNLYEYPLSDLRDAFRHAVRLENFDSVYFDEDMESVEVIFPPNMCCFGIHELPLRSFTCLHPFASQLRELNLQFANFGAICHCSLFERCPNLEVLYTADGCGDTGLQAIGMFCKNLRKLTHDGCVTHIGLIALAQGCSNLEYLKFRLVDDSNVALECIGTHLKSLRNFCMECKETYLPLDNGIKALLMGCRKLERLDISLCRGGLTDVGMGYIGKYGHKLRYLSLDYAGGNAGLVELSKGCRKLRKLILKDCAFKKKEVDTVVFKINSLRYVWLLKSDRTVLALTRPPPSPASC